MAKKKGSHTGAAKSPRGSKASSAQPSARRPTSSKPPRATQSTLARTFQHPTTDHTTANSSVETRIQSLEKGLAEDGLMCLKLSGQSHSVPASDSDPRVSPSAPTSGPGAPNAAMPIGAGVPLSQWAPM